MINTYAAPLYLIDDIEHLIEHKYQENVRIKDILTEFKEDLQVIHDFTRKISDYNTMKITESEFISAYNLFRSGKSMNLYGPVVDNVVYSENLKKMSVE